MPEHGACHARTQNCSNVQHAPLTRVCAKLALAVDPRCSPLLLLLPLLRQCCGGLRAEHLGGIYMPWLGVALIHKPRSGLG